MATPRRVGAETSETRALPLDRAEELMLDEGYAAVTYRVLAARAGVTGGLVQYYFRLGDIRIDESEHGPPEDRHYAWEPTFLLRRLRALHLVFTPSS